MILQWKMLFNWNTVLWEQIDFSKIFLEEKPKYFFATLLVHWDPRLQSWLLKWNVHHNNRNVFSVKYVAFTLQCKIQRDIFKMVFFHWSQIYFVLFFPWKISKYCPLSWCGTICGYWGILCWKDTPIVVSLHLEERHPEAAVRHTPAALH